MEGKRREGQLVICIPSQAKIKYTQIEFEHHIARQ
jgi:hypothetical protein